MRTRRTCLYSVPRNWPSDVIYTDQVIWPPGVRGDSRACKERAQITMAMAKPSIEIRRIREENHPCYGQHGVFSLEHIKCGTNIMQYAGKIRYKPREMDGNDYTFEIKAGRDFSTVIDAKMYGNESRFINSVKGMRRGPNITFKAGRLENGDPCIFVVAEKDIPPNNELVGCYGYDYWN